MPLEEFNAVWSVEKLPGGRRRWSVRPEIGWRKKPGFFFIGRYAPGRPADQADFSHDQISSRHRIIRLNSPLFPTDEPPTDEPPAVLALYWAVEVPVRGRVLPQLKVLGVSRTKFHTADERVRRKPVEEEVIIIPASDDEGEEKEAPPLRTEEDRGIDVSRPPRSSPRLSPPGPTRARPSRRPPPTRPSVPMYRWTEDDR